VVAADCERLAADSRSACVSTLFSLTPQLGEGVFHIKVTYTLYLTLAAEVVVELRESERTAEQVVQAVAQRRHRRLGDPSAPPPDASYVPCRKGGQSGRQRRTAACRNKAKKKAVRGDGGRGWRPRQGTPLDVSWASMLRASGVSRPSRLCPDAAPACRGT